MKRTCVYSINFMLGPLSGLYWFSLNIYHTLIMLVCIDKKSTFTSDAFLMGSLWPGKEVRPILNIYFMGTLYWRIFGGVKATNVDLDNKANHLSVVLGYVHILCLTFVEFLLTSVIDPGRVSRASAAFVIWLCGG